jgi:glycosyltransferase involved in cell wall biosynthesis
MEKQILNDIVLSIFIPVYNEHDYIKECLVSLLSNSSNQFEVIISDNSPNDYTYQIIKEFNDPRFKIFRPIKKMSPQKHFWFAFSKCSGDFVFNIGGDDYFEDNIIDKIIPTLKKDKIYIARFRTFDDQTRETLEFANDSNYLREIIFNNNNFISNYLQQINHDEVMYSFIPRDYFIKAHKFFGTCTEFTLPWIAIYLFSNKRVDSNICFIEDLVFHKRYNKVHNPLNYAKQKNKYILNKLYTAKNIGSLLNCFIYVRIKLDIIGFLKLLFYNRSILRSKEQRGGFLGIGKTGVRRWTFGPVFMFFLSPLLDLVKLIYYLFSLK